MKKIFLLLTITLVQTQVCLTNSEALTSQVIAGNQNQAKDKKPQSWREYCDKKIASTKNRFNNGYIWVKDNPKLVASIAINVALISTVAYLYQQNSQSKIEMRALRTNNDNLLLKLDGKNPIIKTLNSEIEKLQNAHDSVAIKLDTEKSNNIIIEQLKSNMKKITELRDSLAADLKKEKLTIKILTSENLKLNQNNNKLYDTINVLDKSYESHIAQISNLRNLLQAIKNGAVSFLNLPYWALENEDVTRANELREYIS